MILAFLGGCVFGGMVGVVTMSLLFAASDR